ncbi:MAG: protein arginine kinase [Clostridia bacterium]|nr:protein arginine kinase [Clostridia bacterium]
MGRWYKENSNNSIVVSSRIRLARNLSGMPFPSRMNDEQREKLKQTVKSAIEESNTPFAKLLKYIDMSSVPENEVMAMVERHVISPEFAKSVKNRAIILSDDESISIMIGEEDHIRIQVILQGLQLEKAYDIAERIDSLLYERLHFAFDSQLGFLTECPTNLGTGLRASVMLHLPVCEAQGEIQNLSETVGKIGFTVRGMYGEGSKSEASLYQVSNQITLGLSENNAIRNLEIITNQIIEKEMNLREELDTLKLEDLSYRALGTLKYARIMSSKEMMNLISKIKLGLDMGIIKEEINPIELLVESGPFMLMSKKGEMTAKERDIERATELREKMT